MDARDFELNLVLPADARFAETMRDLASHAARYAGCRAPDAETYGAAVEGVVLDCLTRAPQDSAVAVIVRRGAGTVEVLITCEHRFDPAAAGDARIAIGWTREAGAQMCRVARDV